MRNVQRGLPTATSDQTNVNTDVERIGSYFDVYTQPMLRRESALADEGSYFVATSATPQTAITLGTGGAFSATAGTVVIQNTNSVNNTVPRRIIPTYIRFDAGGTAYTFASAALGIFFAISLDQQFRYTSGGTVLTGQSCLSNDQLGKSGAQIVAGALVTTAAGANNRVLVGNRMARPAISGTAVTAANADVIQFNFGGVEALPSIAGSAAAFFANTGQFAVQCPPVVIGAGHSMVLHCWFAGTTPAAGNVFVEVGYVER